MKTPASLIRLISIADELGDDDDTRRRKRVGVVAGYLTIVAPLTLPLQTGGVPLSFPLAIGLSAFSILNLWRLTRTGNFERFVILLIGAGVVFVPLGTFLGGGITGSSSGLVWGFLIPAYAILALGPQRATRWFVVYLALVAIMTVVDPWVREAIGPPPYTLQLFSQVQNAVMPLAITFLLLRYTDIRRLAAEARVDELLTNGIPRTIADRLRRGERRIAESYRETSVVFADIVGFTPWAQRTPPEQVVALLDDLFSRFDALAATHGLEKIKTVGDAYMAAAGLPGSNPDHVRAAADLALSMRAAVEEAGEPWRVRIGLHSGPVAAGVIGTTKFVYDLWGDAVNIASRLESTAPPGQIQVSAGVAAVLGDDFELEPRGFVDLKGKGSTETHLLLGRRSA